MEDRSDTVKAHEMISPGGIHRSSSDRMSGSQHRAISTVTELTLLELDGLFCISITWHL